MDTPELDVNFGGNGIHERSFWQKYSLKLNYNQRETNRQTSIKRDIRARIICFYGIRVSLLQMWSQHFVLYYKGIPLIKILRTLHEIPIILHFNGIIDNSEWMPRG
jgi:hypothetical protein